MKILAEVLAVLDGGIEFVTAHGVRIVAQLDRKLYVRVNDVLVALGGKWSRSARIHIFETDARPLIERAILIGEVTTNADLGFFATPADVAEQLVEYAESHGRLEGERVLEPSAGEGAIVSKLLFHGANVVAVEVDQRRVRLLRKLTSSSALRVIWGDFLGMGEAGDNDMSGGPGLRGYTGSFDAVVMNPPFGKIGLGDHLDHVRAAMDYVRPGGTLVAILPNGVKWRVDTRHTNFREWAALHGGEFVDLPEHAFRSSGTDVRAVFLRMRKAA